MHDLPNFAYQIHQLTGFEFSNLTLLVGVLVSTAMVRLTGVNPGGILAAAFLILASVSSLWWGLALPPAGILIAWLYKRFFSHIYVGRQPLFIMAAMSVVIMTLVGMVMQHYGLIVAADYTYPLGIILPAILAAAIIKQGPVQTFGYAAVATVITISILMVIYSIGRAAGHDFYALDRLIEQRQALHLALGTLQALVSIAIGFTIYKIRNVKSAGYILLPFLATLCVVSPRNFLMVIGLAIVAYFATWLMRRYSLLLGVSRYTFVLVLSVILVWTVEYVILYSSDSFSPFMGTNVFAALAIAVLVNEHSIYGARRAAPLFVLSLSIMIAIELGSAYTARAFVHQQAVFTESRSVESVQGDVSGRGNL
jgi:hypothetical protein